MSSVVRNYISPQLTKFYAWLGFANRTKLAENLQAVKVSRPDLFLDDLVKGDILKKGFRKELTSPEQLQSFMLKGSTYSRRIDKFAYDESEIFPGTGEILSKLSEGLFQVENTLTTRLYQKYEDGLVSKIFYFGLGIPTFITFGALMFGLSGSLAPAILGTLTASSLLATKLNDRLPVSGFVNKVGGFLRFLSRKAAPFIYLADTGYISRVIYEANLNIENVSDVIGVGGTWGIGAGLVFLLNFLIRGNRHDLDKAYGGKLDPGIRGLERLLMSTATFSSAAEVHYMGARLLLWGSATAYLFLNVLSATSILGIIPLATPILFTILTAIARSKNDLSFANGEESKKSDREKIWMPLWGLAAGAAGSLALAAFEFIMGKGMDSLIAPIAYGTFYGSTATIFLNELHGSFNTINTNQGEIATLKASSKDLVGEQEARDITKKTYVLSYNPNTGLWEHTYGLLGTVLLNRKSKYFSFLGMFDKILSEMVMKEKDIEKTLKAFQLSDTNIKTILQRLFKDPRMAAADNLHLEVQIALDEFETAGLLTPQQIEILLAILRPNLTDHRGENKYLDWVEMLQNTIFTKIHKDIKGKGLPDKYDQLIINLKELADYFDKELRIEIEKKEEEEKGWLDIYKGMFDTYADIAEYRRALFEELSLRAEEFREIAKTLQLKRDKGFIDYIEDFYPIWEDLLGCYDPHYIKAFRIVRKLLAGDELEVRKVENVATGGLQRGVTLYKAWYKETFTGSSGQKKEDRLHAEEWIGGSWSQVLNPYFRYDADPGKLEASKFLWIPTEYVLTDIVDTNKKYISNSRYIYQVDNQPQVHEGFKKGDERGIHLDINDGMDIPQGKYYYVADPKNQDLVPEVKDRILRDNVKESDLPTGYQLAHWNNPEENPDVKPYVFTIPAFDDTLMEDKNDINLTSYLLLPAILEREKREKFAHFVIQQLVNGELELDVPLSRIRDLEIDLSNGIHVVDANLELIHKFKHAGEEHELFIPYKFDRAAAHVGVDESVGWKSLKKAKLKIVNENGKIKYEYFSLIYKKGNADYEVPLPSRNWPRYLKYLNLPKPRPGQAIEMELDVNNFTKNPERDGDMSWLKLFCTDGSICFARIPDGKRPMLFNKDLFIDKERP